jgi:hypothetical protein
MVMTIAIQPSFWVKVDDEFTFAQTVTYFDRL